ncbi:DUF2277 domain-containing protein, partial [Actinomadura citrea]|uniref:DUF2277 domain-containing protein n=2 Tax=Thermomonosporaceae TaxID=2012 RepID=UPI003CE45AAF
LSLRDQVLLRSNLPSDAIATIPVVAECCGGWGCCVRGCRWDVARSVRSVGEAGHTEDMCRSIKTLRPPYSDDVTDEDVRAAALQYVRKISGFRAPASHNAEAFDRAVEEIARSTAALLDSLQVRGRR